MSLRGGWEGSVPPARELRAWGPRPPAASEALRRQREPPGRRRAGHQHQHPLPGQHHRGQDERRECGPAPGLATPLPTPQPGAARPGQRPGAPSALLGAQGRAPRGCPPTGRCCPQVLWPYLLEFLVPVRFTRALTPLCRSLVHLAQKRQEQDAGAFLIQYNGNGAPRPRPRHRSHPDPDAGPGTAPTPALAPALLPPPSHPHPRGLWRPLSVSRLLCSDPSVALRHNHETSGK